VTLRRLKPRELQRSFQGSAATSADQHEHKAGGNRFAALRFEQDDDENDDEEDLPLPSSDVHLSKPVEPQRQSSSSSSSIPSCLTLKELICGSDREAAILFLLTLDEVMGFNSKQYVALKRQLELNRERGDVPPLGIVQQILKASTVANFGIHYVQFLEENLTIDFPHMNTIYRLVAVVVFPELTQELTAEVTSFNPNFKPMDAKMFLGDCLERAMRNDMDPVLKDVAVEFCETWSIPMKRVEDHYINGICSLVCLELPLVYNERVVDTARKQTVLNPWVVTIATMQDMPLRECSWLPGFEYIGTSKRSIFMTIHLLQALTNVLKDQHGRNLCRFALSGKPWDETTAGLAETITQDMDQLLTCDIMPDGHLWRAPS